MRAGSHPQCQIHHALDPEFVTVLQSFRKYLNKMELTLYSDLKAEITGIKGIGWFDRKKCSMVDHVRWWTIPSMDVDTRCKTGDGRREKSCKTCQMWWLFCRWRSFGTLTCAFRWWNKKSNDEGVPMTGSYTPGLTRSFQILSSLWISWMRT